MKINGNTQFKWTDILKRQFTTLCFLQKTAKTQGGIQYCTMHNCTWSKNMNSAAHFCRVSVLWHLGSNGFFFKTLCIFRIVTLLIPIFTQSLQNWQLNLWDIVPLREKGTFWRYSLLPCMGSYMTTKLTTYSLLPCMGSYMTTKLITSWGLGFIQRVNSSEIRGTDTWK